MSYILEALKKSKNERQSEETPHLHIVHGAPAYKPHLKIFGKAGMLLTGLGVVLVVGLFFFNQPEERGEVADLIQETARQNQRIRLRQIEIRNEFFEQQEDTVVVQNPLGGTALVYGSQEDNAEAVRILPTHSKKKLADASVVDAPQKIDEHDDLQFRTELPSDIQKGLPEFVFAGHTYADDPHQRMIIINNAIFREGDTIDGDTKLLNIIWEGVILKHRGITFKQRTH